jgi:NitT/TauT family transport system ATP-binding protein
VSPEADPPNAPRAPRALNASSALGPRADAALIDLRGVERRFANGTQALAGADLRIAPQAFVSLLGPSGCGKSTLLRLMAGLDEASAGTITRSAGADDIAFVFQEPTLMPWASVRDNVALPLKLRGWAPPRIAQAVAPALAAVGLADFADAVPRELSGGMKMRASIARALVTRPALWLLDEPFAALDEISRFRLNQDLLALWLGAGGGGEGGSPGPAPKGFTAVFVTHSVYEAVFLSQRVVVMSARPGRITAQIDIDLPYPRSDATRSAPRYTELCVQVSRALHAAVGAG